MIAMSAPPPLVAAAEVALGLDVDVESRTWPVSLKLHNMVHLLADFTDLLQISSSGWLVVLLGHQ